MAKTDVVDTDTDAITAGITAMKVAVKDVDQVAPDLVILGNQSLSLVPVHRSLSRAATKLAFSPY
jgi:ribosomal 50S subunit-associated protein YjgA (DUF615 family)